MVREQCPGVNGPGPGFCEKRYAGDEAGSVGVVAEDKCPLDSPHYHVVAGLQGIRAGVSGHDEVAATRV
jgi:hypothetical protein